MKMKGNQLKMRVNKKIAKVKKKWAGSKKNKMLAGGNRAGGDTCTKKSTAPPLIPLHPYTLTPLYPYVLI